MKKTGLAIIVLLLCASASFAQAAPAVKATVKPAPVALKMVSGKVDAVVAADATKGTQASLSLVDEKGQKIVLSVNAKTTIKDAAHKAIALGALTNGQAVKVSFRVAKDGTNEAAAIKVSK